LNVFFSLFVTEIESNQCFMLDSYES